MRFLLLALALGAAADAELARYQVKPEVARDAIFRGLAGEATPWPTAPDALKHLDGPGRATAVKSLFAFAKAYVATGAFGKRWEAERLRVVGREPTMQTYEATARQRRAALDLEIKTMRETMKGITREQRKQAEQSFAKSRAELEAQLSDRKAVEADEKRAFEAAQARYAILSQRCPADPTVRVRALLQQLLEQTQDVDYNAETILAPGGLHFIKPAYEEKPGFWKLAFRAGPEATEAARAEATAWLAELR